MKKLTDNNNKGSIENLYDYIYNIRVSTMSDEDKNLEIKKTLSIVGEGKSIEEQDNIFFQYCKDGYGKELANMDISLICAQTVLYSTFSAMPLDRQMIDILTSVSINAYVEGSIHGDYYLDDKLIFSRDKASSTIERILSDSYKEFDPLDLINENEKVLVDIAANFSMKCSSEYISKGELLNFFFENDNIDWIREFGFTNEEVDNLFAQKAMSHPYLQKEIDIAFHNYLVKKNNLRTNN